MNVEGASVVLEWVDAIPKNDMFTTALNCAEIWYGIALRDEGRKKRQLIRRAEEMFNEDFRGRILPFDERSALHFADITARRKRLAACWNSLLTNRCHRQGERNDRRHS